MNIDEILLEWSYRLPKGYPTIANGRFIDNREIAILNQILEERGLLPLDLPITSNNQTTNLMEGATEGAVFEEVIVAAWNNTNPPSTLSGIPKDAGEKVVTYLKKGGIEAVGGSISKSGVAYKLANKGVEVTAKWAECWPGGKVPPATKTPKTDILIGDNQISVKMGAAQLMSGGPNESKATFYAALDSLKETQDEVMEEIMLKLNDLTKGAVTQGSVDVQLKRGKDEFLEKANVVNNEVKVLLKRAFGDNPEFRIAFVSEAMTGRVKFSTSSKAYAKYVLASDKSGDNVHLYSATDNSFLSKVASKTDVTVRFKSTSVKKGGEKTGEYRYWSVVALGVKKLDEEFAQYDGQLLTESILSSVFSRVGDYIRKLFIKISDWLKAGVKNVLEFFDLEPEVDHTEELEFYQL
jgi:hypothetical protein